VRENLVVDGNQLQRVLRDVAIHGSHGRDRLAGEAHWVVECVTPLLRDPLHLVVVLLAARDRSGAPDHAAGLVRDDRFDARQRARFRVVYALDARVRMRTAQHARV